MHMTLAYEADILSILVLTARARRAKRLVPDDYCNATRYNCTMVPNYHSQVRARVNGLTPAI